VLVAGAGWWWVRGPAIVRGAVASPPEIDIDPPSMRARREAAIALATMPDDPWTFAESLAASAPGKAAESARDDCGLGDAPQFSDTDSTEQEPSMTRAAAPRYLAAQARVDAALRSSGDALDRAVADFVNAGDLRTDAGGVEAVAQQAAVSSDPRVVSLGHAVCSRMSALPACAALPAERWAQVDAGNGMPWIELLANARATGDTAGVQDAMSHLAAATRFDMHFFAVPGAVVRRLPDDARDLAAGSDLVTTAMGRAAALPFPAFKPLLDVCRDQAGGDEQRARQCVEISDTMYAHSDTLLPFAISGALLFQTTGDASRRESIKAERALFAAHWSPATGLSRCGTLRDDMHKLARNAAIGEVEAMREDARTFVTP
jgi:hypothetical protein